MPITIQKGEPRLEKSLLTEADNHRQYVERSGPRYDDVEDVAEAFYRHREFLLLTMLSGKEGIAWPTSPIFRHLKQKFQVGLQT